VFRNLVFVVAAIPCLVLAQEDAVVVTASRTESASPKVRLRRPWSQPQTAQARPLDTPVFYSTGSSNQTPIMRSISILRLPAWIWLRFISPDQFDILQSIDLVLMIVVGGVGSVHGAFLGAIFLITMPQIIALAKDYLPAVVGQAPGLQGAVYGMVLIGFVLFEPLGLYGRWLKLRTYFQIFPFYRKGMFKRQKSFLKSDRLK
jgi:hypothetical protein